jgi:ribonuclease G
MKKILINDQPWQTRIAIMDDGILQNIYFDIPQANNLERCYFKGKVTRILPGIQTAFVDIGQERSGFLHISEIDRQTALKRMGSQLEEDRDEETDIDDESIDSSSEHTGEPAPRQIERILHEGQDILIQVIKEPLNEKGAKLSTCFTLPGRFLVLMPNIGRIGISKKIDSREERQRLKELVQSNMPKGMGAIIRTTCDHQPSDAILQDLKALLAEWDIIQAAYQKAESGQKIYEDIDMTLQIIRDHLDKDIQLIACDTRASYQAVYKFVAARAPEYTSCVVLYEGPPSIFARHNVDQQLEAALKNKVMLPSGGSIVIEGTEAMTVVDVNTGRYIGKSSMEDTILKINLEAAQEIVRQLRLRNIGGLIVIDFIDMSLGQNRQKLFKYLEKTLKEKDKFQSVVLRVSEFGLVQMTRKRSGKTLLQQLTQSCACCHGTGRMISCQAQGYAILQDVSERLQSNRQAGAVTITLHPDLFKYMFEYEYQALLYLEKTFSCKITLATHEAVLP